MYEFTYARPKSIDEAVELMRSGDDAMPLAGGQTLLPVIKQRLATPEQLIDLSGIEGLRGIRLEGGELVIGAMTRHADVATNATVKRHLPALAHLALGIGDPQVRNRGTLGGVIANNDPAADYPAAVLGLGATVITNSRRIVADDFFQGLFTTALEEGELIVEVRFPVVQAANYQKFDQSASRYAIVGIFMARTPAGVRVAVTGAGADGVFRATPFEEALSARFAPEAIDDIELSPDDMAGDMHASAEYRAHLAKVLTKRAVTALS